MIETAEGIANLDEILSTVSGIDAVFVGPNDLALSLGAEGSSYAGEDPRHRAAIEAIADICQTHNVVSGIMCGSPQVALQWRNVGYSMLAVGNDLSILAAAARESAQQARRLTESERA